MQIEIDAEQATLLREVLDSALRDLSYEIADTDNSEYKDSLKQRREALTSVVNRLAE